MDPKNLSVMDPRLGTIGKIFAFCSVVSEKKSSSSCAEKLWDNETNVHR